MVFNRQLSFSQKKCWSHWLYTAFFMLLACGVSTSLSAQCTAIDVDIQNDGDELCEDSAPVPVIGKLFVNPGVYTFEWSASVSSAVAFDNPTGQVTVTFFGQQIQTNMTPQGSADPLVIQLSLTSESCSLAGNEIISIFPPVTAAIGNGSLANVCQGSSLQLDGIPGGGNANVAYTHLWEVVGDPTGAALLLDDASTEDPVLTPPANANDGQTYNLQYTVTTNDENCNVATTAIAVTVREAANSASLSSNNNIFEICPGEDAVMNLNIVSGSVNPYTYSAVIHDDVSDENTTVNGIPNGGSITFTPSVTTTYTLVSVQNQFGCVIANATGSVEFIVDETNPTFSGPTSQDLNADENCAAVVPNLIETAGASDNCDANLTLSQNPAAGTPFTGGSAHNAEQDITITATDNNGNTATRIITLILKDVTAPTFDVCPANKTFGTDDGNCSADISFPQPEFTENCNGVISVETDNEDLTITNTNGTTNAIFPLGTTLVTYTLDDNVNAETTCSFSVTIEDDELPTVVCPPSVVRDNDNNECSASYSFARPTGSDNCGDNLSTSGSTDNGTALSANNNNTVISGTFPKGITTITYTVSDGVNEGVPCSFTVTVNDVQLPQISNCPANQTEDAGADCTTVITWNLPSASDNCPDDLTFIPTTDNGTIIENDGSGTFPLGLTTVTYTADDGSTTPQTCIFTVNIEDNTDPVLDCAASDNVLVDTENACTGTVPDLTSNVNTANDNCPGTISLVQVPAAGDDFTGSHGDTQTVTITATDLAGNTTTCEYTLELNDIESPILVANCPEEPVTIQTNNNNCSSLYLISNPDFSDNCDADLDYVITTDNPNATVASNPNNDDYSGNFPAGSSTVTITATDDAGLTAVCSWVVIIEDLIAPNINCPANQTLTSEPGVCGANVTTTTATATDNCTTPTPVEHDNDATDSKLDASGFYPVGTTIVTWTATDDFGNTSTCEQTIEVTDNENPTLTCPTTTILTPIDFPVDGNCAAFVPNYIGDAMGNGSDSSISFGDNCAFTLTQSPVGGTAIGEAHNDTEEVTIVITDASGNTANCNFTLRMRDEIAPTISCPSGVEVNNTPGECEGQIPNLIGDADGNGAVDGLTFMDNCVAQIRQSSNPGSTFGENHGDTQTVTITAEDEGGNEATCNIVVTLIDNQAPVFNEGPIATTININTSTAGTYDCNAAIPDRTNPSFYFKPETNNADRINYVSDNCTAFENFTFTQNIPAGTVVSEDTDLIVTVTDEGGNTDEIVIHLILNDNQVPQITNNSCPSDMTVAAEFNNCNGFASWTDPTFEDNCTADLGTPATNFSPQLIIGGYTYDETGTTTRTASLPIGQSEIRYTVTDDNNNSTTCEFFITVTSNNDWVNTFTPADGATVQNNNQIVNFNFTGSGAVQYRWFFGDGSQNTTSSSPTHDYAEFGTYTVCLEINNCPSTQVCNTITIERQPNNLVAQNIGNTTLADFVAVKKEGKVELLWETTSEYDLESFTLEASRNGFDFEDLTDVAGEGELNSVHDYTFLDEYAIEGYNFYRLRQNNMDGSFSYSDIVSAQLKSENEMLTVNAYPNPVTDVLFVQLPKAFKPQMMTIQIYNLNGQQVFQQYAEYAGGDIRLDLNDLYTGNHILRVSTKDDTYTQQIMVQK